MAFRGNLCFLAEVSVLSSNLLRFCTLPTDTPLRGYRSSNTKGTDTPQHGVSVDNYHIHNRIDTNTDTSAKKGESTNYGNNIAGLQ